MHAIELKSIHKRFGKREVLQGIDLGMEGAELIVLCGANGSGKTTLLRILAGLEQADEGEVRIDGRSILSHPPSARSIGYVAQRSGYYEHLTVRANLESALLPERLGRTSKSQRLEWIEQLFSLQALLDRPMAELSGGQIQRVVLGRGLIRKPRLLLLDEPLNHLDVATRQLLQEELPRLQQDWPLSVLYVSHDAREAMMFADRIAVLDQGRIQQVGSPAELYDTPAQPSIGKMFGYPMMQFMPVEWSEESGRLFPRLFGHDLRVLDAWSRLDERREIEERKPSLSVGIRPSSLQLAREPSREQRRLQSLGRLTAKRYLGEGWIFALQVGDAQVTVFRRDGEPHEFEVGQDYWLLIPYEALHLFEASRVSEGASGL